LKLATITEADAEELAALRTAVAQDLAQRYRLKPVCVTTKSVLRAMKTSRVLVARRRGRIIATLRLATKKPWAIDTSYFAAVERPLYLHDMAVSPGLQRKGIGRLVLDAACSVARAWPAQAIRLDAYDAAHGAGEFYARCGFKEVGRFTYRKTPLIYFERLLD
jgi:GNAT superfamily N-acetyltransferase